MIFTSLAFFIFFAAVMAAMIVIPSARLKKGLLLVASYFFYAYWDPRFMALMLGASLINYIIGQRIERNENGNERRRWLIFCVVFNLGLLGIFKYFNFFLESANVLLASLDVRFPLLNIILPVGISFITFEVMSYVIDIYRRENSSAKSFWDLALLVAFFPHLIAGPILKPKDFLPQLEREIVIRLENVAIGAQIFLQGMVKKLLVADNLAIFVDPVFQNPSAYDSPTVWLAVLAYAIQIYCDFSGYTDMAIGSAKCLGFDIPQNFDMPYISRSITEFWRRWHISLSSWLRDYLYISLGGNRKGRIRTYINLMLVMLLGGLWHGASWNFVVWGGLHGGALAVHKLVMERRGVAPKGRLYAFGAWALTFFFVCIAWIFFRSPDFGISLLILRKMFMLTDPGGTPWYPVSLALLVPLVLVTHFVRLRVARDRYFRLERFSGAFALVFTIFTLLLLSPVRSTPFIYFQF